LHPRSHARLRAPQDRQPIRAPSRALNARAATLT